PGAGHRPQHAHRPGRCGVHGRGRGRRPRRCHGRPRAAGPGTDPALPHRCAPRQAPAPVGRRRGHRPSGWPRPAHLASAHRPGRRPSRARRRRAATHETTRRPPPTALEPRPARGRTHPGRGSGNPHRRAHHPREGELMATKQATSAPSTPKELKDTLWKAADKLRGSMDASQYKDVVLGLVFLKYVSDAFEERREAIRAELAGEDEEFLAETLEEVDEYTGAGVFWVAPEARWEFIAAHAKGTQASPGTDRQTVGDLIDAAMGHLGRDNTSLEGTLPR